MYSILIGKSEAVCANCKHYHPHYVRAHYGYARLREGHCCYPRFKTRGDTDACGNFVLSEDEERFVSLKYEEV